MMVSCLIREHFIGSFTASFISLQVSHCGYSFAFDALKIWNGLPDNIGIICPLYCLLQEQA